MDKPPPLRRLIDLPGVADLEFKALMKPRYADPDERAEFPEIDACLRANFGLTADEAEALVHPDDWDGIETLPDRDQVEAFEAVGWDVTDNKRRPLRMLGQFKHVLWLAVRGVAGQVPFHAEAEPDPLKSSLAAEARAFRRDRR